MPDGSKRKRRNRGDSRSRFYALYRAERFKKKFGGIPVDMTRIVAIMVATTGERK